MKNLKLLSKNYFLVILFSLFFGFVTNSQEVVDAVMTWWREEDGDLIDELVDCLTYLSESGPIWLLTPKVGRDGHVEPSDIQDAAQTAGLSLTSTIPASKDWTATRLVARKSGRK